MGNYLVYTGNFYPHKNLPVLIQAADKLQIKTFLIGKQSVFVNRLPKSDYVEFKHDLSDSQIRALYKQALCFVTPSLLEGFGLPGLEAMAAGLPVIAARASCLPEIYGDAALYFDPYSVDDLVSKIQLVISDQQLAKILINKGYSQAKKYSWRKTALQTWQIYLAQLNISKND